METHHDNRGSVDSNNNYTIKAMSEPKVIIFDVETAPMVTATFSLYPENIGHNNIIEDWFMICAAWKELGKKKVESIAIKKKGKDKDVVSVLRDALADADILIAHNGAKFDIKKLNTRLIYHRLKPMPKIPMVDTLKEVRKISAHSSNRLDYLGQALGVGKKQETTYGLWLRAMKGDREAIAEMVKYNIQDVILNEKVYNILRPYMDSHPHMGVLSGGDRLSCPKCGSVEVSLNGSRVSVQGIVQQRYQCRECFGFFAMPKGVKK
jgi:uncharacterized protein YprB with RNaseH-like and TPR domain